jgi:predicted GIY-YIG superfamily endonuclease
VNAGDKAKSRLNAKLKEPQELVFFHGALYEFTYNDPNNTFTQSSMCLLFELPAADTISNFQRVKMLAAPVGIKDFQYDPATTLQEYLHAGWREVFVGVGPEKSVCVGNRIKAQRRQYGLRHRFASTVHSSIGYTLMKVGIEVSDKVRSFKLWDKAQVIVVISRTKVGKNTIFVGNKESTLNALCSLVRQKNQWTDYMENVLNVVSLNSESSEQVLFTARSFPYRICDMTLPDCNTGFVYMLVSSKNKDFSYIGETISIRRRLQSHNSGFGSRSTAPSHLRPFAVFALICGFDGNKTLRCHVEYQWKRKRDALRRDGIHCLKRWAMCTEDVLDAVNMENFNMERSQLRLALYFKE